MKNETFEDEIRRNTRIDCQYNQYGSSVAKEESLEEKVELLLGHLSELLQSDEITNIENMLAEIKKRASNVDNEEILKFVEDAARQVEKALTSLEEIQNDITDNLYNLILENTEDFNERQEEASIRSVLYN